MSKPKWLNDYFGSELEKYAPTVVLDGARVAVLRIQNAELPKEFRSVGFILVRKNGRFDASTHKSLHEGIASAADMERMIKVFNDENSKP